MENHARTSLGQLELRAEAIPEISPTHIGSKEILAFIEFNHSIGFRIDPHSFFRLLMKRADSNEEVKLAALSGDLTLKVALNRMAIDNFKTASWYNAVHDKLFSNKTMAATMKYFNMHQYFPSNIQNNSNHQLGTKFEIWVYMLNYTNPKQIRHFIYFLIHDVIDNRNWMKSYDSNFLEYVAKWDTTRKLRLAGKDRTDEEESITFIPDNC